MTADRRTCEASVGNGEDATAVPTSQATSSTLTTLTTAPASASTTRAGRQVSRSRSEAPSTVATTWPTLAARKTSPSPTSDDGSASNGGVRARSGAKRAPRTPPPRKPTKDSTPTTKPWR